jgi:hypothetical protein
LVILIKKQVKQTTIRLRISSILKVFEFFKDKITAITFATCLLLASHVYSQNKELDNCNIVWTSQSKNSRESMPCGGGDIGLNIWVEQGDILFYIQRSGTFDENNAFLKLGRVRIKLSPNPFEGSKFKQELILKDGYVKISGSNGSLKADVNVWVDVFNPVVHVEVNSSKPIKAEAIYESWRYQDRPSIGKANNANSYKWAPQGDVKTWKDEIEFTGNGIQFHHRNKGTSVFDVTVKQQALDSVKDQLFNPLKDLTFGGMMEGTNMKPSNTDAGTYLDTDFKGWRLQSTSASRSHKINIYLHTAQTPSINDWQTGLLQTIKQSKAHEKTALTNTRNWWKQFWNRSFVFINPGNKNTEQWQAGRNYQLFRYMLGCNAFGKYPTKFNGGLFTYDPSLTDSTLKYTPDFRNWGGGTHTAQNQRLVYFPTIKNGDYDLLKPQLDFYVRLLKNAELRSKVYWQHNGASFTEQLENFGLPNPAEYGWKRPDGYDKGMEYNAWLEYEWDTVLEFCLMMLETERYNGDEIKEYIPFIESCLTFFNEHYQYLAKQRGSKTFDGDGHIIFYPGSGAETYKMAYNSTSTITGLRTILTRLLELPANYLTTEKRKEWQIMLERIPPITFAQFNGHKTIAPAKLWERIANINLETTQLYPVFPWGVYGVGKGDLETAINTWRYDTNTIKKRNYIGWRQDNIFAARLGLTDEAAKLNVFKMKDSGRRFPAFWGPGYDWTPDHNWGGAGMIGLQEMLLQTDGQKIYLFPAWPKDWDVHFKLHAPYQTTVEGVVKNGKVETLKVVPQAREKDIINMF